MNRNKTVRRQHDLSGSATIFKDYSMDEIEKYFYDKAKWREQQINSILDDN
jgi:hypothetical protein